MAQWWRDIRVESGLLGLHTKLVEVGLRYGIKLFIASEVLFFARFFWAFFHARLSPNVEVGGVWPPVGIFPFNKFGVPLLNIGTLLRLGIRVTWAHHATQLGNHTSGFQGLVITVALGGYFTFLQRIECLESLLSVTDNSYLYINNGPSNPNPATNFSCRSAGPNNSPNPGQPRGTATLPIGENTQDRENTPLTRLFVKVRIPTVLTYKVIFDITVAEAECAGPTTPVQIDDRNF